MTKSGHSVATIVACVIALALPALSLIPLGSLWLWQHGLLLHWAIGAALAVGAAVLTERWFLRRIGVESSGPVRSGSEPEPAPDPGWSPAEEIAWKDVQIIAGGVDSAKLTSRDEVLTLGLDTISAVARRLHPEVADPVWRFTVPEAFGIIEQVSRRLGQFTRTSIPLSDRMTVAQMLALYRWRGAVGVADRAYDIWRLVRLVNPMTAATQEVRERLSRQMFAWGQAHVTERLARAYVNEVGRAAIDLYGGRLRIAGENTLPSIAAPDVSSMAASVEEPLRILVAGQPGASKSSFIVALSSIVENSADFRSAIAVKPAAHQKDGLPPMVLIDSAGLEGKHESSDTLLAEALDADLILWVVAARRTERSSDRRALAAIRDRFAKLPTRRAPPILIVVARVDLQSLIAQSTSAIGPASLPKADSTSAAIVGIAEDLSVPPAHVVPVDVSAAANADLDALRERILLELPAAARAQTGRRIAASASNRNWRRTWKQAFQAGRVIAGAFRKK